MKRKNEIDGISIKCFVTNYLGTEHSCSKLKHQGLKSFNNPYVVGAANDLALKYPDFVFRQELIVVIDDYGNPGTYVNPNNIQKIVELEICKEKIKLLEKIDCYNFEETAMLYPVWIKLFNEIQFLESLYKGTYELLFLMNKTRLLREIRKYAKEEAKRTLLFTKVKMDKELGSNEFKYDSECFEYNVIEENENIIEFPSYEEQVTEKVNRQKRLNYKFK